MKKLKVIGVLWGVYTLGTKVGHDKAQGKKTSPIAMVKHILGKS